MRPTWKRNPAATAMRVTYSYPAIMKNEIESMTGSVQETLDELFAERLIPFALSARVIDSLGLEEYIVRFQDAPLRSIDVSCSEGQSFTEMVRAAVLDRVSRMGNTGHATVR